MTIKKKMNGILRSIIFASALIGICSFPWQYLGKYPIVPAKMAIPYSKYILKKYVFHDENYTHYKRLSDIYQENEDLKVLSYLPFQNGPRFQTIYLVMGFTFIICLILIGIPSKFLNIFGFVFSIAFTVAFSLNLVDIYQIPLTQLQIPVYLNLLASTIGLSTCVI